MYTNATKNELETALSILNKEYEGNISFETLEQKTKNRISFTLKAISGMKGARYAASGRKLPKASWHVHGQLFDILFNLRNDIYVIALGKRIDINGGNWQQCKIGGDFAQYQYMSQASIKH